MTWRLFQTVVAIALAWSASSWAQVIYKSTMPDGQVIYGSKPEPGAKRVEKMQPPAETSGVRPVGPKDEKLLQQRQTQREKKAGRQTEIDQAEEAVRDAEAAQAAGKEPLPGERQGTAGGGSRLTEEYWQRQEQLAAAVADARKRLDALRGSTR